MKCVLVLKPDGFWDTKQKVDNCTRSQISEAVIYIPLCRLHKYINPIHLPPEFGGTWIYNHTHWINNRLEIEDFVKEAEKNTSILENVCHEIRRAKGHIEFTMKYEDVETERQLFGSAKDKAESITHSGYDLIERLEKEHTEKQTHLFPIPQDVTDTKDRIKRLLEIMHGKLSLMEEAWNTLRKMAEDVQMMHVVEKGMCYVTNWILGEGELLLNSQQSIGYDMESVEKMQRAHETVELQCRETYGQYAQVLHKVEVLKKNGSVFSEDINSQKEFMDFVCRSFATRVEKRRNVLITAARFFRLVSQYFNTTNAVYENFTNVSTQGHKLVQRTLEELQCYHKNIDALEKDIVKEGEKLSDLLAIPVKDALGRELPIDYVKDISHVREILDMTIATEKLFRNSLQLQKLTLLQVTHIQSYESDASQALEWLNELYSVLLQSHCYVGYTLQEIQVQKHQHQCFQDTAKDAFEFGYQLLRAALALRQSCRLSQESNADLLDKMWQSWNSFHCINQEQLTRLRVSAVFHRNVKEYCEQLVTLTENLKTIEDEFDINHKFIKLRKILEEREKLLVEVGRMIRLGKLLKVRLKEPVCSDMTVEQMAVYNEMAISAVNDRLSEVTQLAERIDEILFSLHWAKEEKTCEGPAINSSSKSPQQVEECITKTSPDGSNKSEEDFQTASDCSGTTPSRSSSFHTGSEGDQSPLSLENEYVRSQEQHKDDNVVHCDQNKVRRELPDSIAIRVVDTASAVMKDEETTYEDSSLILHDYEEKFEENLKATKAKDTLQHQILEETHDIANVSDGDNTHLVNGDSLTVSPVSCSRHVVRRAITGIF